MVASGRRGGIFGSMGEEWRYDMWQICSTWNASPPPGFGIKAGKGAYAGVEIPSIGVYFSIS